MSELIDKTGLSHAAAKQQLLRLDHVRRIVRTQDFFVIVSPEEQLTGAPPAVEWLDDYFKWLERPYYLALLSAAAVYGSQPQAIQVVQVMTDAPRRDVQVGRQRIRFYFKAQTRETPTQQSTPEATVLDLIRYVARIGGFSRAEETIIPMLPLLRAPGLRKALEAEDEPALGQRLGYILESAGKTSLASTVQLWLPSSPLWTALEPAPNVNRQDWPTIPKWRLIKNVS
jgi:hypothetical protein